MPHPAVSWDYQGIFSVEGLNRKPSRTTLFYAEVRMNIIEYGDVGQNKFGEEERVDLKQCKMRGHEVVKMGTLEDVKLICADVKMRMFEDEICRCEDVVCKSEDVYQ